MISARAGSGVTFQDPVAQHPIPHPPHGQDIRQPRLFAGDIPQIAEQPEGDALVLVLRGQWFHTKQAEPDAQSQTACPDPAFRDERWWRPSQGRSVVVTTPGTAPEVMVAW